MPYWDDVLTPRDKEDFALSGYGKRGGFGQRPGANGWFLGTRT
jgi:hypothetical protein